MNLAPALHITMAFQAQGSCLGEVAFWRRARAAGHYERRMGARSSEAEPVRLLSQMLAAFLHFIRTTKAYRSFLYHLLHGTASLAYPYATYCCHTTR